MISCCQESITFHPTFSNNSVVKDLVTVAKFKVKDEVAMGSRELLF